MIERNFFFLGFSAYLLAFAFHALAVPFDRKKFFRSGRAFLYFGGISTTIGLGIIWHLTGYPPWSNMSESLITFSILFVWISLFFTYSESVPWLEAGISLFALLLLGSASLFIQESVQIVKWPSFWLYLHVLIAYSGKACFAISFLMGILFLSRKLFEGIKDSSPKNQGPSISTGEKITCLAIVVGIPIGFLIFLCYLWFRFNLDANLGIPGAPFRKIALSLFLILPTTVSTLVYFMGLILVRGAIGKTADRWLPPLERLDELTYEAIALGYPLYSIGAIVLGMAWSNQTTGRYWSWTQKEILVFITFLVYSIYLHMRLSKGWQGTHTALLSILGFLFTLLTLFGANFLSDFPAFG